MQQCCYPKLDSYLMTFYTTRSLEAYARVVEELPRLAMYMQIPRRRVMHAKDPLHYEYSRLLRSGLSVRDALSPRLSHFTSSTARLHTPPFIPSHHMERASPPTNQPTHKDRQPSYLPMQGKDRERGRERPHQNHPFFFVSSPFTSPATPTPLSAPVIPTRSSGPPSRWFALSLSTAAAALALR